MNSFNFARMNADIAIVLAFLCFAFCVLATTVLFYFIRRRYCLYIEIKGISGEKLWYYNFQNHLKNLRIKVMICNFVILIILVEIVNSSAIISQNFLSLVNYNQEIVLITILIVDLSTLCHVPLLCLFMKVLWLVYLHCPYKYTIMRWAAYIVLRLFILYIVYTAHKLEYFSENESMRMIYEISFADICMIFLIFDFITYLRYSRRFYLHLKSRELEAKLFMDRDKYIENKYLRIHFKVATILVAIALFFYTVVNILSISFSGINFLLFFFSFDDLKISHLVNELVYFLPIDLCQIIFRILLGLNYVYVLVVILYKYCKKKQNLKRVNDRIRPLVLEYQDQIFTRQYY